ncbi:MAG TPA: hypothetical protein VEA69_23055 [Tepidisphaeraceae bacterium]|nr:hypothetical protein [Tepidisphaeraceae bacterium]
MGWGRFFFLGDFGQQMDIQEQRDAIDRVRRSIGARGNRDQEQDARIEQLERELGLLKLYVGSLCQVMAHRGSVTAEDLGRIAEAVYAPAQVAEPEPQGELDELARAAREAEGGR